ncbi:MAG: Rrf2 family transcriptional regulator [Phycisphaeraceae bacterium]|mgnify:CR=1 FL=1|nr:Rrf2 family transcriptional regulator [Phycisphaerae bacterium]MBX3392494.1 Rrf2 family transcriptional regulator [Phycisphaeraceae bacterium]HRJ50517.1 Rrf2 family transcriptional regulator [Phycisphaerales bacterium]
MFSLTAEYALRAMACLALTPDQLVPTPNLARQTKVPPNYLAKVLQLLSAAGLIAGRRGVGGGYRLARASDQITLLEVLRSVTQVERIRACPLGIPSHGTNLCPLHRKIDEAAATVIEIFGQATLADLLTDPSRPWPLCETTESSARITINGSSVPGPGAGA